MTVNAKTMYPGYKYRTRKILIQIILSWALWMGAAPDMLSQSIQITHATRQSWAGGVCCRTGTSYQINLQLNLVKYSIQLDSLWLEGYCRNLSGYNQVNHPLKDTVDITIRENLSFDDGFPVNEMYCYDPDKKGVIISYIIRKKKYYLNVSPFMKELEFIGYP